MADLVQQRLEGDTRAARLQRVVAEHSQVQHHVAGRVRASRRDAKAEGAERQVLQPEAQINAGAAGRVRHLAELQAGGRVPKRQGGAGGILLARGEGGPVAGAGGGEAVGQLPRCSGRGGPAGPVKKLLEVRHVLTMP